MSGDPNPTRTLSSVNEGDIARLRKAHPCGGRDWSVTRVGADIGLECRICGRKILLSREEFERRCVAILPSPPSA